MKGMYNLVYFLRLGVARRSVMHSDVTFARCSEAVLLQFVCCRVSVTVQQRQEEKRQKEEFYKEKDRERKRVQSSKKVNTG